MVTNICPKCKKILKFVRWENRFGNFVKIMECGCKELTPVLPNIGDKEIYDG